MWRLASEFFLICHFSLIFSLTFLCTVFFIRTRDRIVGRLLLILTALFIHSFASLFYNIFSDELAAAVGQVAPGISLFLLVLTCVTVPVVIYGVCRYMLSLLELNEKRHRIGTGIITVCALFFFLFGLYFIVFLHGSDWSVALSHALNELFIYGSLFLFFPALTAAIFLKRTREIRNRQLLLSIIISFIPIGIFAVIDLLRLMDSAYKLVYLSYVVFLIHVYLFTSRHYMHRYEPEEKDLSKLTECFCLAMEISEREGEIVRLLIEGRSNNEISESLFISQNTVKTHVRNIYRKAGVSNRLQLLAKIRSHP
ncbi:MAG: helix-turn-helix transcriptional regulator [Spirochaetales bacterium]|uniref:Helix-turn-helix transcriptional regulator n=1 Tax=Candidatus Thalassospirochaeta sargassi TaxID=3119039 RepID=A0AAJ1IFC7_9SPIO|nr:helix-turn-helix transcriptional regulator [Spirochaetales bacterium]